jgi:small-conductance mechanosensitive channel
MEDLDFTLDNILQFIIPLIVIVSGFIAGIGFESFAITKLRQWASKSKWKGDDVIVRSFKKIAKFLFFLVSVYISTYFIDFLSRRSIDLGRTGIEILIGLLITWFFANMVAGLIRVHSQENNALSTTTILENLSRIIIFSIGGLIILNSFGISITPILTTLGIGGLAVALALQDTLSNFFAGLSTIATNKIKTGDYVRLEGGEEGYVQDISWRYTTIRMLQGNQIIVPNNKLSSANIINYYLPDLDMAVLVNLGVSYDSDLQNVEKVTVEVGQEVMKEVQGGVPDFEPFIRYNQFADFSINFTVILRCKEFVDQYLVIHEFVKRLHKRYKEEEIEIPFPVRTIYDKTGKDYKKSISPD